MNHQIKMPREKRKRKQSVQNCLVLFLFICPGISATKTCCDSRVTNVGAQSIRASEMNGTASPSQVPLAARDVQNILYLNKLTINK